MNDFPNELLLLAIPLAMLQLGLMVYALWDLTRPNRLVRGGSRLVWGLVIVFVNLFGPIVYLLVGREEREEELAPGVPPPPPAPGAIEGWAAPTMGRAASPSPAGEPAPVDEPSSAITPAPVVTPASVGRLERAGGPSIVPAVEGEQAVVVRGLTKRYGGADGVLALDRLDLDVPAGPVFGLLGPNGAGKTTTLRMLAGLAHPTAGTATVAGVPIDGGGPDLTRRIGFLDQDPRYYGWATGDEVVMLAGMLHGMRGAALEQRTREVMAQVGLAEAARRRVATYSGGMRQRLGIAQALVNRPSLLILDEPVSSLDPEGRRDLLALIADFRGSATVLFSTHVLADVERICDRVGILDHGHLVTEGPLEALLDRYALPIYQLDPERGQDEAVARLAEQLREAAWTVDVAIELGRVKVTVADPARAARELLPIVVAAGVTLVSYERVRPTLEDVFLRLVGRDGEAAA